MAKAKEHTYCGKNQRQMRDVILTLCEMEDRFDDLTKEQKEAFDIALRCIATVSNRMKEERPIEWD